MKKLILLNVLITFLAISYGQSHPDGLCPLKGEYLGQAPPGIVPQIFAPGIISSEDFVESNCLVWNDGRHIMVFRINTGVLETSMKGDCWDSLKLSEEWGAPTLLHSISPDGRVMFYNYFGTPPDGSRPKSTVILKKEKTDDGWKESEDFRAYGMWPSTDPAGNLYYTTRVNGYACIARRPVVNGVYADEEILLFPNPEKIEFMHPCISHDGSYLIMDAENSPHENGCELYITFKTDEGLWTKPQNMGDLIPLKGAAMARLSSDGKYIFFQAEGDIYWVSVEITKR
jgi:hypothetical protein